MNVIMPVIKLLKSYADVSLKMQLNAFGGLAPPGPAGRL